ncbi:MAG TPA: aminoglycoside phosphotransferase family protein [Rubrobacter sp.]|nr:aminoglycoside phosphotransferase family protein [Rubrobacter sp.]
MAALEYSRRLGSINDDQFRSALARLGLGEFVRAEPVSGGLFGQNVLVASTTGEYVLRGAPHYDWQFPAERFFARLLHERTLAPIPWPYFLDPCDDIFGWSYALMPRMPGLQLADSAAAEGLTSDERLEMARSMGENLALLHALSWPCPGQYDLATDTIAPLEESWNEWVAAEARRWLTLARRRSDVTTDADAGWVEDLLRSSHDALGEPFEPRFVMHDYGEHNVTFEQTDGLWHVSGVFDLMEAFFGDREMDLSRQTAIYLEGDPALARTFLRTYLELLPARPGFQERFPAYMLLDRLVVWEYAQRPQHEPQWDRGLTLREWAEPYTASRITRDLT